MAPVLGLEPRSSVLETAILAGKDSDATSRYFGSCRQTSIARPLNAMHAIAKTGAVNEMLKLNAIRPIEIRGRDRPVSLGVDLLEGCCRATSAANFAHLL